MWEVSKIMSPPSDFFFSQKRQGPFATGASPRDALLSQGSPVFKHRARKPGISRLIPFKIKWKCWLFTFPPEKLPKLLDFKISRISHEKYTAGSF